MQPVWILGFSVFVPLLDNNEALYSSFLLSYLLLWMLYLRHSQDFTVLCEWHLGHCLYRAQIVLLTNRWLLLHNELTLRQFACTIECVFVGCIVISKRSWRWWDKREKKKLINDAFHQHMLALASSGRNKWQNYEEENLTTQK